jgi:hypothetical protein
MEFQDKGPFSWADTPWTIAALLGVWGVFLGIEEFLLANIFMLLVGVSFAVRLFKDTLQVQPRKKAALVLGLIIIIAIVGVDIRLTAKKKASSEKRATEIPSLNQQIRDLQRTVDTQNADLEKAQQVSNQHVSDIQDENKRLRTSIEQKDAALVSIAKDQYALNFFPQVIVSTVGFTEEARAINNGKTNVDVYEWFINGAKVPNLGSPSLIVPGSQVGFKIDNVAKNLVLARAADTGTSSLNCSISIQTLDGKRYSLPFNWIFTVKDKTIVSSFAIDRSVVEIKKR